MSIVINGTGTISGISATNGLSAPQTGSVLQVVQATNNTQYSTASATPISTGIAASITPLFSTSKILVIVNLACVYNASSNAGVGVLLYKASSLLFAPSGIVASGSSYGAYGSASGNLNSFSFSYLDSPATTSSTTYTIYENAYTSGTAFINYTASAVTLPTSTITLMEIAG